jgi:CBS domain-containing protein
MMEVREVMTSEACTCTPETNLAAAAMLMWEHDCGVLPVVDDARKVVGIITDRDICMAAAMRPLPMSEITVKEVISGQVHSCTPETDIREALKTIQREKVHRLAIVGTEGELHGVLSMNDIALEAKEASGKKANGLSYKDVVETYKALCEHRALPQPVETEPLQQGATAG